MLDHPGGPTDPVGALSGISGDSVPNPVDLKVDDISHLDWDVRVPNCTMIDFPSSLDEGTTTATSRVAAERNAFTLIPS
jgi:hypothetical protein